MSPLRLYSLMSRSWSTVCPVGMPLSFSASSRSMSDHGALFGSKAAISAALALIVTVQVGRPHALSR